MNTKALAEQTNNTPEQWTRRDKKIRAETDEIEIKTKYPESLKWSVSFFEKIKKVVKSLSKLSKIKRRPQFTKLEVQEEILQQKSIISRG